MEPDEADHLRVRTWEQYGATARGLEIEFGVPQNEFFEGSIDRLQIEDYLVAEPGLAQMLHLLPQRLYVFTNSPEGYAQRALMALGIADQIKDVFHIGTAEGRPKPEREFYDCVIDEVGETPERVLLVEDTEANLVPAAELGMVTVKLGPPPPDPPHRYIERIEELPALLGLA